MFWNTHLNIILRLYNKVCVFSALENLLQSKTLLPSTQSKIGPVESSSRVHYQVPMEQVSG